MWSRPPTPWRCCRARLLVTILSFEVVFEQAGAILQDEGILSSLLLHGFEVWRSLPQTLLRRFVDRLIVDGRDPSAQTWSLVIFIRISSLASLRRNPCIALSGICRIEIRCTRLACMDAGLVRPRENVIARTRHQCEWERRTTPMANEIFVDRK